MLATVGVLAGTEALPAHNERLDVSHQQDEAKLAGPVGPFEARQLEACSGLPTKFVAGRGD